MASPRELAEQAFALMQDALRDAESRVAWSDRRVADAEERLRARMDERTSELGRVRAQLQIIPRSLHEGNLRGIS